MENFVVGMGEALWDILPEGKKIGGAPANFAYHVSQFGLPSLCGKRRRRRYLRKGTPGKLHIQGPQPSYPRSALPHRHRAGGNRPRRHTAI